MLNSFVGSAVLRTFFTSRFYRDGQKTAVVDYDSGKAYSYWELKTRSGSVAAFLMKAGVKKGDRVALCARNGPWSLDIFYAMPLTGCILSTYNCMLKETELSSMMVNESPKILFYEAIYAQKALAFKKFLPDTQFVVIGKENPLNDLTYDEVMMNTAQISCREDLTLEDICMLLHTGGTTGTPKAAMISYRAVIANTIGQVITYSINEDDVAYVSFPFFHCASWNSALPILLCGGKVILKQKFTADDSLRMVDKERLTFLAGSPTVFRRLAYSPLFQQTDFSSVRGIRCGSATPTLNLMQKYWAKGLPFYNGYGMTEAGPGTLSLPATSMSLELAAQKAGSVGMPMIFTEIRIVDDFGNDVPIGEEGELIVRNATMFSGYWRDEEATAHAVKDGWLHTGDIARCDEDGFYFICGRKKNMYISGGENIYPPEIETFVLDHPAVEDAYIFGVPDCNWGEVGKALIVV